MIKIPMYLSLLILLSLTSCKDSTKSTLAPTAEPLVSQTIGGLALYTLRDSMSKDAKGTLLDVSKIGFNYVEAAGYVDGKFYGMQPREFRTFMDSIGLEPRSTHMNMATLENIDTLVQDVKAAGFTYFVIPVPPMGHFIFNKETKSMSMDLEIEVVTEILNTFGKKCHDEGLQLLYHNHDFEFKPNENGIVPMEYFLTHTNPEYVNFEMDLYWVTKAGGDPVAYFEKYPGRFKAWHIKDMDDQGRFAPVGEGTIDFERILAKRDLSGMQSYFVEQDVTYDGLVPLDAIKISHKAIKGLGFK